MQYCQFDDSAVLRENSMTFEIFTGARYGKKNIA